MIIAIILFTALLWLASYFAIVLCTRQGLRIGWAAAALTAYPAWWLLQILLANALSHYHVLTQSNLILCACGMIILALLCSRQFHRVEEPVTILPTLLHPCAWEMALIGGILVLSSIAIFFNPSKVFDTTTYHLPTVATWLQQHSMDAYPTFCDRQVTRSHAATVQQFWVIGMAHADPLGELPDLLACVIVALSIWCITRRWRLPLPVCLTATISIWAIPQIVHASLTCKDDLMLTAGIMCGLYCLIRTFERNNRLNHWYAGLAGVSIALVFGAKVPGLAFGTALLLTGVVYSARRRRWQALDWSYCILAGVCMMQFVIAYALIFKFGTVLKLTGIVFGMLLILTGVLLCIRMRRSIALHWINATDWILIAFLLVGLPIFMLKYYYTATHFGVLWPEQSTEIRKPSIPVLYPLWYYFRLFIAPFHRGIDADHDYSNYGLWFALVTVPVAMWGMARSAYQRWKLKRQEDVLPPRFLSEWHLIALFAVLSFGFESIHKPDPWDQRFMIWLCPVLLLLAAPLLSRYAPIPLLRRFASVLVIITLYFILHYGFPCWKPFVHLCRTGEFSELSDMGQTSAYYVAGYEVFSLARPGDVVLYLGADGTVEYPCWGWRLDRVVEAPTSVKQLEEAISRHPRWLVLETPADHILRNAAQGLAMEYGYTMLADAHPIIDPQFPPNPYNSRTIWIREPVAGMWKKVDPQDLPGQRDKLPQDRSFNNW